MKGISDEIKSVIKQAAEEEWPGNFVMQLHVVEEQLEAFVSIDALKENNTDNAVFQTVMKKAVEDWPDDYVMQLDTIKEQLAAAVKLANFSDLTGDKCFEFTEVEQEAWTNEDMQMLFYRMGTRD